MVLKMRETYHFYDVHSLQIDSKSLPHSQILGKWHQKLSYFCSTLLSEEKRGEGKGPPRTPPVSSLQAALFAVGSK